MLRLTSRWLNLAAITACFAMIFSGCIAGTPLELIQGESGEESGGTSSSGRPNPSGNTNNTGGGTGGGAGENSGSTTDAPTIYPFEAQGPDFYVNKVKTLLTGLPASTQDVASGATSGGLSDLVDAWMKTDAYQDTLMTYFKMAFQLSLFNMETIAAQVPYGNHPVSVETNMLVESFPRTVLDIVNNNRPFTEVATTRKFMMTPRLLLFYALIDQFGDGVKGEADYFKAQNPNLSLVMTNSGGAASLDEVTDPTSSKFMVFPWATLKGSPSDSGCDSDLCMQKCGRVTIDPKTFTYGRGGNVWNLLTGGGFIYYVKPSNTFCTLISGSTPYTTAADNTDWRMVTLRTPKAGELPDKIYDLQKFRTSPEMVFRVPRVGFFTQPAFLGQWNTNENNQSRSTINQTMIVGLNRAFDGSDQTKPTDLRALPLDHAAPGSSCYSCHVTMDPMRQYFIQSMNYSYHPQVDPNLKALPGAWGQNGQTVAGGDLTQLGDQIAKDPQFALAWVVKTCSWINSGPCENSDPEVIRIARAFQANNFNFNSMFKEVVLSPLTTYKAATLTATQHGLMPTVARRDQFCKIVGQRIQQPDICGDNKVKSLLNGFPTDGYSRGTTVMAQARIPSLATRLALENICGSISTKAVDTAASGLFSSSNPTASIKNLVTTFMGVPSEDEAAITKLLTDHFNDAKKAGLSAADSLRSAFTVACLSPYVSTIGM